MSKKKVEERQGYIYLLRNLVNGKGYVGQTIKPQPELRWAQHINAALSGRSNAYLHRAMRKYGLHNFTAKVVWQGVESKLNAAERRFIKQYKTFVSAQLGWGYNLTTGGGAKGVLSKAARHKIGAAVRAAYKADPTLSVRIGAAITLAYKSNPALGKRMSYAQTLSYMAKPQRREQLSIKAKANHKANPAVRKAVGYKLRGRKMSDAAKQAISEAHFGIVPNEASRLKMSESAKQRFKDPVQRAWLANLQTGKKTIGGDKRKTRCQITRP